MVRPEIGVGAKRSGLYHGRARGMSAFCGLIWLAAGCSPSVEGDDTQAATQGAALSHNRDEGACCTPLFGQCKVGLYCDATTSTLTLSSRDCELGTCVANASPAPKCSYGVDSDHNLVVNTSADQTSGSVDVDVCITDTHHLHLYYCGTDGLVDFEILDHGEHSCGLSIKEIDAPGPTTSVTCTDSAGDDPVTINRGTCVGPRVCIVRPAIVESALRFPFPGWNEGFTTTAPLAFLNIKGHRAFPAGDGVRLDVIPVDLVAAGLIMAIVMGAPDEVCSSLPGERPWDLGEGYVHIRASDRVFLSPAS